MMEDNFDYTVAELIELLKKDNSWEEDEQIREACADGLYSAMKACGT